MRTSRFVSTLALSVYVATVAVGCADGGDGSGPGSVPRSVRAQDALLQTAQSALVRRCLTDRHIEPSAEPGTADAGQDRGIAQRREFPYGIDDPEWAAEHGFGSGQGSGATTKEAAAAKEADVSPRQQRLVDALFGTGRRELSTRTATGLVVRTNSDGCLAEAQRVLYGDQGRWFRTEVTINNLGAAAHQRVTRDPAYRAVLVRWARCVAPVQKAEDPGELRRVWQRRAAGLDPQRATESERRYAVAEARCVLRTGLADTGARLERRHAAELRTEYADVIAEHRRLREHGLRFAVRQGL
ncbi:hypothetical protein [Streptomyces sp. SID13726]|uniref:hypothetical protein n=1 Tax=Streptomyces sp. SID13726 TaxID=2706058 RepID=UPI0013BE6089|nr:hypothetical protein [Streptomyces sp. SID13726]NEA98509.1 hypothetical protein [Streptomyces sp. SID13726]